MSDYLKCDFCFLNFWMRRAVSENCLVALRFSKNLNALLFRCSMNVSSRTRLQVGFRCFEGHFRTRWCLRHVFCGVMHHCVVRRSGSVPTEIAEPTREAQSSRHVFIETLQSKDFSEILLICVNFGATASRFHQTSWGKNRYSFPWDIRNIMSTAISCMCEIWVNHWKML